MKRSKSFMCLGTALLVASGTLSTAALAEEATILTELTEWISDDGGTAGRELPTVSADGRYVVFIARSSALQGVWLKDRAETGQPARRLWAGSAFNPDISANGKVVAWSPYGSGEGGQSVLVLEWQKPGSAPVIASLGDNGQQAVGADFPSLSADGRYVAFQSKDKTLDADAAEGKTGGGPAKVYVRDMLQNETEMVSVVDVASGPDQIVNGNAVLPDVSPDGRFVAFASDATVLQGLSEETEDTYQQVYLRDRETMTTIPVSVAPDGITFGNGGSAMNDYGPSVSADGSTVAFDSDASNLVAGDTNEDGDAFVRDMVSGTTFRVSLDATGEQADVEPPDYTVTEPEVAALAGSGPEGSDEETEALPAVGAGPVLSADGRFVAFESLAALTADDTNSGEASCTPEATGITTSGHVDVADVYLVEIGDSGVVGGSLARQSLTTDVAGSPEPSLEARGFRIEGMTNECIPAFNGADPAISADGTRVVLVSNGNLTGHAYEAEEFGKGVLTDSFGIEPGVYLHRPIPEPDIAAPVSKAKGPQYANTKTFVVKYAAADSVFPWTGVNRVQLWLKRPGETAFVKRQVDIGDAMDNAFTVRSLGVSGRYAYYTVALDNAGNWESAPAKADAVTVVDLVAPVIKNARAVPNPFDISDDRFTEFKMRISEKAYTTFVVKRNGVVVKRFATQLSPRGLVTQAWFGRNDAGLRVLNGDYVVVMRVKDPAGNLTVARVPLRVTR
jgi:hypothetical protein